MDAILDASGPVSLISVLVARLSLRRRRLKRGLCLNCGYDLRATPWRCPECVTVPKNDEHVST